MSGQLSRPIELFDERRGDIFSICREDFLEIYEYDDEDFLEVMRGLGAFFVGNKGDPEPEIKARDKRNVGVIKRLIDHQKVNAMRELKRKESALGAAHSRWRDKNKDANACERIRKDATAVDIAKDKAKDKEQVKVSLSLVGDKMQNGLTPSALVPHSAEEAKKILAMDAPPIASHPETTTNNGKSLNADGNRFATGTLEAVMFSVGTKIYPDAINEVSEDVAETLQEVLDGDNLNTIDDLDLPKSFFKTPLGSFIKSAFATFDDIYSAYEATNADTCYDKSNDVFKRALLDAAIGSTKADVENRAGFIIARLKKVANAVKVLESAKAKKPLGDADY